MDKDRNLLFGILAVQLKGVSPAQMVEAAAAWATAPGVPLSRYLLERGLLQERDRDLLDRLVDEAIRAHGGDASEALQSLGGEGQIRKTFCGMGSSELDAMQTAPMTSVAFFAGSGKAISGVEEAPGRYTLISHHAKGGMGRVLLVHDEYLGRNIALKELLPLEPGNGGAQKPTPVRQMASLLARFLQEARVTGQLEHPSIVPVYELGRRQDGTLYYTMKLVRGQTMAQALHGCTSLKERLDLLPNFIDLCQAIAYAHSRGVIHRDVKPANVMVGHFGETVVLDWGLAKVRDTEDINMEDIENTLHFLELEDTQTIPKTAYGRALGTPHYMPPEQAEGRVDVIDERSDVYSLGAVLYELLTGTTPYTGKSTREIIDKVIKTRPAPVLQTAPDTPPELAVICEKAMQRDSADRYQSAVDLADDIQRFITGSLVKAYRYSLKEMLTRYYQKHRAVVNTVAASVIVLIAVALYSYVSIVHARNREHAQRIIAEEARRNEAVARDVAEGNAYLSQIRLAQACLDRGDHVQADDILWKTQENRRGWEWAWLLNRANPDVFTSESSCSLITIAAFSPNGRKIAVASTGESPRIWDSATGRPSVSLEGEPFECFFLNFSLDVSKLVAGGHATLRAWDVATGKLLRDLSRSAQVYSACIDDSASQVFAGYDDGIIRVWSLENGALVYELPAKEGQISDLRLLHAQQKLVAGYSAATLIWDLATRTISWSATGRFGALSQDGSRIATTDGAEIRLWNVSTGAELHRLTGHEKEISSVSFNAAGTKLISASFDRSVKLWETADARNTCSYNCDDALLYASFVDGDRFILTFSVINTLTLWDADTGLKVYSRRAGGEDAPKNNLPPSLAPDMRRVALATGNPYFQVWDLLAPPGQQILYFPLFAPKAYLEWRAGSRLSREAGMIAVWSHGDRGLDVFPVQDEGPRLRFEAQFPFTVADPAMDAAISLDGSCIVSVGDGFVPIVWRLSDASLVCVNTDHTGWVGSVDFNPEGTRVVSGSWDKTARVWDAGTGETQLVLQGHTDTVSNVRFSPDGRKILTTSGDRTAALWSAETGKRLLIFSEHSCPVTCGGFSRDGSRVITAGTDGRAYVWSAESGERLAELRIGLSSVLASSYQSVSFSPNDRFIVTSSFDSPTRIWDAATYESYVSLDVNNSFQFLDDERSAIVIDLAGVVSKIEVPPWRLADIKGGAKGTWQEKYREFKLAQSKRPGSIAVPPDSTRTIIPIGKDTLVSGLRTLQETLQQETGDGDFQGGILIHAGPRLNAGAQLGLRAGDGITHGDGRPLTTRQDAIAWAETAAGNVAADKSKDQELTLSRNNRAMAVHYRVLPARHLKSEIRLTGQQAARLISLEKDQASDQASDQAYMRRQSPEISWPSSPLSLLVAYGTAREVLEPCGLSEGDVVLSFDGKKFLDYESLMAYLERLDRGLQDGEASQFSREVQRGSFETITFRFVLK